MLPTFSSSAATDIGPVRRTNQDAFLDWSARGLWAVADGMGGHAAGDEASRMAIQSLSFIPIPPKDEGWPLEKLLGALDKANWSMLSFAETEGHSLVGTTICVVSWLSDDEMAVLWCGDSRVYHVTGGQLRQITRDHTVAQRIADTDPTLAAMVANSKAANTLTHALGVESDPKVEVTTVRMEAGDTILICSDGLYGVVVEDLLLQHLNVPDIEGTAQNLIDAALAVPTKDNVTAVVIRRDA